MRPTEKAKLVISDLAGEQGIKIELFHTAGLFGFAMDVITPGKDDYMKFDEALRHLGLMPSIERGQADGNGYMLQVRVDVPTDWNK